MWFRKGIVTFGLVTLLTYTVLHTALAKDSSIVVPQQESYVTQSNTTGYPSNIVNLEKEIEKVDSSIVVPQQERYVVIQFIAAKDYTNAVKLKKEIEKVKIPIPYNGEIGTLLLFLEPEKTKEGTLWKLRSAPFDNKSLAEKIGEYLKKDYFVDEYKPVEFPFSPYVIRKIDSKTLEENLDKLELCSRLDDLMVLTRIPYSIDQGDHVTRVNPFQLDEKGIYTPTTINMSKIKDFLNDDKFEIYEIGLGSYTCPIYVMLSIEKYRPPYDIGLEFLIVKIH